MISTRTRHADAKGNVIHNNLDSFWQLKTTKDDEIFFHIINRQAS